MTIEVLYFAAVRDLTGLEREEIPLPADVSSVEELGAHLEARHDALRGRLGQVRFAVNEEFAEPARRVNDGDVVALIPPVAGGSEVRPAIERVAILHEPLRFDPVIALVKHPGAGALATFVGVVRDHAEGREVTALEYSAYESMARTEMARVIEEIEGEIPVVRLAAHHRVGELGVGEEAVICAASAPHRGEAFEAGRALIDRIKARVPIWKRERGPDGAWWVGWEDARCTPGEHHH
ncbi:MAG TPA: molybdopterin converting factor subunit 1 [Sandaracinaceae bacterium LLY-WYZ-13_1]|nr:molybdopterin converting factor subunit 1 [Sandaracinaceae bacterium LLY-WYZ-13_1]